MGSFFRSLTKRPLRLLIVVLSLVTVAAAAWRLVLWRPPAGQAPSALEYLREQLALGPVLEAEEALRQKPADLAARLRLVEACASTGDPCGAALAISPLLERSPGPGPIARYVHFCTHVGWLDEAAAALNRLPGSSPELALRLADRYVTWGRAEPAEALLARLERERLRPDQQLEGAVALARGRRYERAVAWARRGAARQPGNPAAKILLARCLLAAGRPEEALRALPQPLPGAGPDLRLETWRGRAEIRSRQPAVRKAGLARLERVLRADPHHNVATFEVGREYLRLGMPAKAQPLLEQAARSQYQEILCYPLLARAHAQQGRRAQALHMDARYQMGRGFIREAADTLRRALELDPQNVSAQMDLAAALFSALELEPALEAARRAEGIAPQHFDLVLMQARMLQQLQRIPEAVERFERAASIDPARASEALVKLGNVYFETQEYDRAIAVLERAVRANDRSAEAHLLLGRAHARLVEEPGHAEKAVYHLIRSGMLHSAYYYPWLTAGPPVQRIGGVPEAAACYRRAIDGESPSDGAYIQLARLLQLMKRPAERRLVLKLYAARQGYDLKRARLEHYSQNELGNAQVQYEMGDLLLRSGRPINAFPHLLRAAAVRPGWKQAQSRLADVCALLDYDDLREQAERAAGAVE